MCGHLQYGVAVMLWWCSTFIWSCIFTCGVKCKCECNLYIVYKWWTTVSLLKGTTDNQCTILFKLKFWICTASMQTVFWSVMCSGFEISLGELNVCSAQSFENENFSMFVETLTPLLWINDKLSCFSTENFITNEIVKGKCSIYHQW